MFHNYETEKITHKASDAAEYIEILLFRELNKLHYNFVATLLDNFNGVIRKKMILTFWALVTVTLG